MLNSPNKPLIIAHRGVRSRAPENTLAAIRLALAIEVHGVELDITLSKDNCPVIAHQETLSPELETKQLVLANRVMHRAWTREFTAKELKQFDAGSWFDTQYCNECIPTLKEVLSLPWEGKVAFLELKDPAYWRDRADDSWALLLAKQSFPIIKEFIAAGNSVSVISFSPHALRLCKKQFPDVPRIFAIWENREEKLLETMALHDEIGLFGPTIADFIVLENPNWREQLHDAGMQLLVYEASPDAAARYAGDWSAEIRRPIWKQLLTLGVDGITADFPDELLELIALDD